MGNSNIREILIVRPCAIGDFIQTLPAIRTLRNFFPFARIEIVGNISTIELANNEYYADSIDRFDRPDFAPLFAENSKLPESTINYLQKFDLAISYLKDEHHIFANNLQKCGVQKVIPFAPLPPVSNKKPQNIRQNIVDHLLEPIIPLCRDKEKIVNQPLIHLSEDDNAFAINYIKQNGLRGKKNDKILAIHPGSGSKRKNWPIENFIKVTTLITENLNSKLLIICGPADDNTVSLLQSNLNNKNIHIIKNLPLIKLAAILKNVDCFLGNDSGISHIAAAVVTPSILIFGPTDPNAWAPRGENVKVIKSDAECYICQDQGMIDCNTKKCLENVTVDKVFETIKTDLGINK